MPTLRILSIRIIIGFVFILLSCNSKPQSLAGTWVQEGYGRILEITDSTYTYFNISEKSCLPLIKGGKLNERFKIVHFNKDKLTLNPGGIVNYHFKRSKALPTKCNKDNSILDSSPEKNFEVLWNTFNKHYAFFNQRNINWNKIKEQYQPKIKTTKTDKELYKLFVEILKPFNDGHIKLDVPDSLLTKKNEEKKIYKKKTKKDLTTDIINNYVNNLKTYNNGVIQWGNIKNSKTDYILITDMNDFSNYASSSNLSKKEFDIEYQNVLKTKSGIQQLNDELKGVDFVMSNILKDLANSKSVIIDLRFNGGGYETVALKILSYFIDQPKHILSIKAKKVNGFTKEQKYILNQAQNHYTGYIYLLTSNRTASAAEIFALGTLAYPKIKRYGSSTEGIFSEILWKNLPNGWEFSLSNEVYTDSNGNGYEITGVPVNYKMNYPKNRIEFYNSFYEEQEFKDLTIETIIKINASQ
ncbi:MAG: hypothetical protein GQ552_07310 [Flavobacteriaceae bacterium]|nr:hypothetical protein [Flavobacteriaceae bacterium]